MINYEEEYNNLCNCYRELQTTNKELLEALKSLMIKHNDKNIIKARLAINLTKNI